MSVWPNFSNFDPYIRDEFDLRKDNPEYLSSLNTWARIISGVTSKDEGDGKENGLVIYSNPDLKLFNAAGDDNSIYGDDKLAGTIGKTLSGKRVEISEGRGLRPSPTIESITIEEGKGSLSRKATLSITAFTREQMQEVTKYFLEPGYTLFLEWGWNTDKALRKYKPNFESVDNFASYVSQFQSFSQTQEKRFETEGHSDNYLGYITGGSVAIDGDKWTISVNLTGYTELPAYLITNDKSSENNPELGEKFSGYDRVKAARSDLGRLRFMQMYNSLPQNRRLKSVKQLVDVPEIANEANFLNFDTDVRDDINSKTNPAWYKLWLGSDTATVGDEEIELPAGTQIINDERYIRFETLMDIINRGISINGYKLKDKIVSFYINSDNVPVSAFKHIYSTDPSRLYIPNPQMPQFTIDEYVTITNPEDDELRKPQINKTLDNSIQDTSENREIKFPISDNDIKPVPKITLNDNEERVFQEEGKRDKDKWGYLNDLYVNFDFAMNVLDTKNLYIKDALYQILNGMSSAVNGLWDFQIIEKESVDPLGKRTTFLSIVDVNFSSDTETKSTYELNLIGTDSILLESSLDLELGGAIMNSVIGQRLSTSQNSDSKRIPSLFGDSYEDAVLKEIAKQEIDKTEDTKKEETENVDEKEIRERNVKAFLDSVTYVPKESIEWGDDIEDNLFQSCYLVSYDNDTLFSLLKRDNDKEDNETPESPSPLMPIEFSFTVLGISGIKRGDKFKVKGLPSQYENGFFQVLSVNQTIEGMSWVTEVVGGFRR